MTDALLCFVDIGGTKITAGICNEEGFLYRVRQKTRLEGPDTTTPSQVLSLLDHCIEHTGASHSDVHSLGVSTAGPFEKVHGQITMVSPNMCGGLASERGILPNDWTSIPLERELRKSFPDLAIGNDAVTGAVAERSFGAGIGVDDLVYVTWSTGIGTGAFVDGHLISGKNGNAPHGGHVYLTDDGPQCGCGNFGDLESLSSGTGIGRDYGKPAEDAFKDYPQSEAKEVVENAARYFARGLVSINAVLDTSLFIIGGSVFLQNEDILLPLVRKEFYDSFPTLTKDVKIEASALREHLGDLAGLSLVMPSDVVEKWKVSRPWVNAPPTVQLDE